MVSMFGPRQVGKTTLARQLVAQWAGSTQYFDLEDPDDQARLADPSFVLRQFDGLVLDEIAPGESGTDWLDTRWLRGGFPRALLAKDMAASRAWCAA